jgi:CheY-like chemotaxis protein
MAKATFPKTIAIIEDAPADIGVVEADATQLHQVLLNLCVNARDAVAEGGIITLRARREELTAPIQTARGNLAPGNYIVLEVSDTGSGMSPEVATKIFDPFFSTKAPDKGTGLGLSTVAMIVEIQRGGIVLRTAPGEGTTFSIFLPAAAVSAKESSQTEAQPLRNGAGRSVLVADDEVAIAEIMRETLEGAGYKVTLASDGLEALAVAGDAKPEIAVVDLLMPRSGGPETMRELRLRFPNVRIVAISGLSAGEVQESAAEADAILQKPFTLTDLLHAVGGDASLAT